MGSSGKDTEVLPVAIIGAGIAGLTLAAVLGRQGRGVVVFEARPREALNEAPS